MFGWISPKGGNLEAQLPSFSCLVTIDPKSLFVYFFRFIFYLFYTEDLRNNADFYFKSFISFKVINFTKYKVYIALIMAVAILNKLLQKSILKLPKNVWNLKTCGI